MLAIDTVLQNRYRIVHQLGQGGMGAVYKAIDERLNKTVAIKEVIFEFKTADNESQRNLIQKAFQREANSLVKARHEAVPDITDYFSELDRSYLVMEYVEGDDLAKMLEKRGKPFSIDEISPWIIQLLEAIDYLHHLVPPILHRDIKPQNLKLNNRHRIKLLDFGIARSTDKNAAITQSTFLAATLNYAPFEQVLRVIAPMFREFILLKHRDKAEKFVAQDTDARCDIFAVGATFYHLLTNQIPVDVTERALGIWEKGTDKLLNPSEINPEISPGVSEWLIKAMSFEREDRFTSAREMKEALQKIIAENNAEIPVIGRLEEAILAREQQLMQAKTEQFIIPKQTEEVSLPEMHPSSAESAAKIAESAAKIEATDAFTPGEFGLTDFNTDFSVRETSGNLTDRSINNEKLLIKQNEPETRNDKIAPPQTTNSIPDNRKYILILLIMGILVFAVSGIALYAVVSLMSDEKEPKENKTTIENINIPQTPETTPSLTANVNTNVKENINTTGGNTETNSATIPNAANKEQQKTPTTPDRPTVTPTSTIVVEQSPKFSPTPKPTVSKTPTPQGADYFVYCHVKSDNGTVEKIRKNRCPECPKGALCEFIFYK